MGEISQLLDLCGKGDAAAKKRLYSVLYQELTRQASSLLARSGPLTLDPASIVHEAWLKSEGSVPVQNRSQFFAYSSAIMRNIIVDHIRERTALKRGGGITPVTLTTNIFEDAAEQPEILDLDEALNLLRQADERSHDVVQMRFFGGMKLEEIADALGVSLPTVKRDLAAARSFLYRCFQR